MDDEQSTVGLAEAEEVSLRRERLNLEGRVLKRPGQAAGVFIQNDIS